MARMDPYEEREYVSEAKARLTLAGRVTQLEQGLEELHKQLAMRREHAESNEQRIERLETETGLDARKAIS